MNGEFTGEIYRVLPWHTLNVIASECLFLIVCRVTLNSEDDLSLDSDSDHMEVDQEVKGLSSCTVEDN